MIGKNPEKMTFEFGEDWNNAQPSSSKIFWIQLDTRLKNGDVIMTDTSDVIIKLIKYYENNWWNRFLKRIGFDIRIGEYKAKHIRIL